ncbi:MAG: sigma-54 dependent transcriptional regulator [Thermogutta sp.]|jgi:two-component system response regulator HydG|uniref:sigma-54-dependent transcriptional regulator n=1 Tax=Thermogutta terrifontis TaxID=1331910 RepID=UPI000BA875BA|nr:sigma-54 dependent transcriptional regulator [Thermogutta terrifontis]
MSERVSPPEQKSRSAAVEAKDRPTARILIIDNDPGHAEVMAEALEREGYRCRVATSGPEGAKLIREEEFDVIITDLVMNEIDGLDILRLAKQEQPEAEVILVTGHGTIQSAVTAMREGAFNYLLKPLDLAQLRAVTEKAVESVQLRRTNVELHRRLDETFGFQGIVGNSPQMRAVLEKVKRIAPTNATVLILGETGTGKELIAQAIHQNSPRKNKPFVALNCAALSENILESELFGHVKGAFTDACADRVGKFEYAHGGTLFLDEVGDMPMATQIKLLRVLENGEITRVGSNDPIKVNVRVLSATNQNLEALVEEGRFRRDLYHRLNVVSIRLPSLAERAEDIPILIDHFMKMFAKKHNKHIKGMTPAARRRLQMYSWPGNVRELRNVIESMTVVDYDGILDVDDLPEQFADGDARRTDANNVSLAALVGKPLEEIEKMFIAETLRATGGNREEAARLLGIGERTLYRKIKEYGLS